MNDDDQFLVGRAVRPSDPLTFIAVAVMLTTIALAASYVPGRRAARVDPAMRSGPNKDRRLVLSAPGELFR